MKEGLEKCQKTNLLNPWNIERAILTLGRSGKRELGIIVNPHLLKFIFVIHYN